MHSSRGQVETKTLMVIGELILAALIILGTIAILASLFDDRGSSEENFKAFSASMRSFVQGKETDIKTTYFIEEDHALYGYDTDDPDKPDGCDINGEPAACLCLHKANIYTNKDGILLKSGEAVLDCVAMEGQNDARIVFSRAKPVKIREPQVGIFFGDDLARDDAFNHLAVGVENQEEGSLKQFRLVKYLDEPANVLYVTLYDLADETATAPPIHCPDDRGVCGETFHLLTHEQGTYGVTIQQCMGYGGCPDGHYCVQEHEEKQYTDEDGNVVRTEPLFYGGCKSARALDNEYGITPDPVLDCGQYGPSPVPGKFTVGMDCGDVRTCLVIIEAQTGMMDEQATSCQ